MKLLLETLSDMMRSEATNKGYEADDAVRSAKAARKRLASKH